MAETRECQCRHVDGGPFGGVDSGDCPIHSPEARLLNAAPTAEREALERLAEEWERRGKRDPDADVTVRHMNKALRACARELHAALARERGGNDGQG